MTKTHKTAAVIIPPRDVWEPIQRIRRQHDRKIRRWMPHITLLYPFCEPSQFQSIAEETAAQCQDVVPFDVSLTTFDTFSRGKGHYTVWLTLEPYEAIRDLHAAVWTALSCDEDYEPRIGRFTPHLSVGQVRGRHRRQELLDELANSWQPVSFRVSEMHFIDRNDPPDDVFRVARTIRLGGDN
jgi:2'-5' RNA ligase